MAVVLLLITTIVATESVLQELERSIANVCWPADRQHVPWMASQRYILHTGLALKEGPSHLAQISPPSIYSQFWTTIAFEHQYE
jgi:hypothetical protein